MGVITAAMGRWSSCATRLSVMKREAARTGSNR